jgi:hypothetical protein
MIDIIDAIHSLVPEAKVIVTGTNVEWIEPTVAPITNKQIEDEVVRLQTEYDAKEYQRLRQYPSIGDQLDMLWHAIDLGKLNKTSDFYLTIKAVKDSNPKSE